MSADEALGSTRLIVVTDTSVAPERELEERIAGALALAAPRTVMVQLRDKALPIKRRLALGTRLCRLCREASQWFVVNDRIDLAVLLGADGVHLGEASVAPADVRRLVPAAWISRACHHPEDVGALGVDAVLLSPIVAARKGRDALGFDGLRAARRTISAAADAVARPRLFALGGVTEKSAAECLAAGADGVAVVGAVLDGRDPRPLLDVLGILAA